MKRMFVLILTVLLLCVTGCDSQGPASSVPTSGFDGNETESAVSTQLDSSQTDDSSTTSSTAAQRTSSTTTTVKPTSATKKTSLQEQVYVPTMPTSGLAANQRQLIPDNDFYYGMTVRSQKDHDNGDAYSDLGQFRYMTKNGTPSWIIAQWDSGPCLWNDRVSSAANVLTDGKTKWVTYLKDGGISLRLDSAPYYANKPNQAAIAGDYWPHLLLEAPDFGYSALGKRERSWYRCDVDELTLSLDVRLSAFSHKPNAHDFAHISQYLLYFYVKGLDSQDFVWFGITLFSSEQEKTGLSVHMDGGKADASGQLIYQTGTDACYAQANGSLWKNGKPAPGGDWVHIEIDMAKHLKEMFAAAQDRGYFSNKVKSLADLKIDGMNIGFESVGTYDVTMDIRNLSLVSARED